MFSSSVAKLNGKGAEMMWKTGRFNFAAAVAPGEQEEDLEKEISLQTPPSILKGQACSLPHSPLPHGNNPSGYYMMNVGGYFKQPCFHVFPHLAIFPFLKVP